MQIPAGRRATSGLNAFACAQVAAKVPLSRVESSGGVGGRARKLFYFSEAADVVRRRAKTAQRHTGGTAPASLVPPPPTLPFSPTKPAIYAFLPKLLISPQMSPLSVFLHLLTVPLVEPSKAEPAPVELVESPSGTPRSSLSLVRPDPAHLTSSTWPCH